VALNGQKLCKIGIFEYMTRINRWYAVVRGPIPVLMPHSGRSLNGTEWYVVWTWLGGAILVVGGVKLPPSRCADEGLA